MDNLMSNLSLHGPLTNFESALLRRLASRLLRVFIALDERISSSSSEGRTALLEDVKARIFISHHEISKYLGRTKSFTTEDLDVTLQEVGKIIGICEGLLRLHAGEACTCKYKFN